MRYHNGDGKEHTEGSSLVYYFSTTEEEWKDLDLLFEQYLARKKEVTPLKKKASKRTKRKASPLQK
jgi:hypothetical protein